MKILHVVPYMHPNAGGPPVVVDRMCRRLAARGHGVRVITTDVQAGNDPGWESAYTDGGYELDVHRAGGEGSFAYSRTLAPAIRRAVAESDLVHLHTVWTYPSLRAAWACRNLGVPYAVMPHGMLDPNSVMRKRVKKWIYSRAIEGPNLRRAAGMIYTHAEEERLARESMAGLPMGWIVPLAADEPPAASRVQLANEFIADNRNLSGSRLVLFLGRLHSKKGLDLLLPAFVAVAAKSPDTKLVLVGPGETGYVDGLKALAAAAGIADRVAFVGPLSGRKKWAALAAASVFVLPSYQENFAITVVEAMTVGTPVLLSRRVNIWPEIQISDAGVILELDKENIADNLVKILGSAEFAGRIGNSGQDYARRTYNWDRTADAVERAYLGILSPSAAVPSAGSVAVSQPIVQ